MRAAFVSVPVLATALILGGAASQASAATLPDGETMYGYDSGTGTLYVIDEDAGAVAVGVGGGPTEVWGMDYNAADGLIYMFNDDSPCELWSLNRSTGVATLIDEFFIDGDPTVVSNCDGFDIDENGIARLTWGPNNLSVVNLATAELTNTVVMLFGGDTFPEIGLIATNPITGELLAISYSGGQAVIVVDPDTGVLGASFIIGSGPNAGDFDSAGTLWMADSSTLASLDATDADPASTFGVEGTFDGIGSMYALTIAPTLVEDAEPELAATGVERMTSIFVSAIAVAAGLSLVGFAVLRRRERATAAA